MDLRIPDFSAARPRRKLIGLAALPAKRRAEIQAMGRAKVQERIRQHDRRAWVVIRQLRERGRSLGETALLLDSKMASPGRHFGFEYGRGGYWSPMAVKRIEDRLGRVPGGGGPASRLPATWASCWPAGLDQWLNRARLRGTPWPLAYISPSEIWAGAWPWAAALRKHARAFW